MKFPTRAFREPDFGGGGGDYEEGPVFILMTRATLVILVCILLAVGCVGGVGLSKFGE